MDSSRLYIDLAKKANENASCLMTVISLVLERVMEFKIQDIVVFPRDHYIS